MTRKAATGTLRLVASRRGPRTVLTDVNRTTPFHPGPVHQRDERAEIILQEVSPGLMPGDRLEADILVEEGASLAISGQGATKIYPSVDGVGSEAATTLRVAAGGTLWWLPGPLIPFREARYQARTTVALQEGACFAALEIITAGRIAMGECHAYQRLDLRFRVDVDGRARIIERALLEPRVRPAAVAGSQGGFPCSGTLITIGYPPPNDIPALNDELWLGMGVGTELTVVRGLAFSAERLRLALIDILDAADVRATTPISRGL